MELPGDLTRHMLPFTPITEILHSPLHIRFRDGTPSVQETSHSLELKIFPTDH